MAAGIKIIPELKQDIAERHRGGYLQDAQKGDVIEVLVVPWHE